MLILIQKKIKVKLPKIVNGGINANKLNKDILNEVLSGTYIDDEMLEITYETNYDYLIKEDIIAIYVVTKTNANQSGDGYIRYNYFYDIKNDKNLELSEVAEKWKINDLDGAEDYTHLVKFKSAYVDNEWICESAYLEIYNESYKIHYSQSCA